MVKVNIFGFMICDLRFYQFPRAPCTRHSRGRIFLTTTTLFDTAIHNLAI